MLSQARRGQILEHAEKSEEALEIWLHTLEDAKSIVRDCREQLKAEIDRLSVTEKGGNDEIEAVTVIRTGPQRQRLRAGMYFLPMFVQRSGVTPEAAPGDVMLTLKPYVAIEIEHMCTFFVANAYYQIKTDETKTKSDSREFLELQRKEELTYERAKILRKELLREAHNKADTLMSRVNEKVDAKSLVRIPEIPPLSNRGGIESRTIFERLENLVTMLQNQATQINEWRDKTIGLLLLTLVDEEEADLQGDEYETSTKRQDEVRCI